jgi:hypothetical protein
MRGREHPLLALFLWACKPPAHWPIMCCACKHPGADACSRTGTYTMELPKLHNVLRYAGAQSVLRQRLCRARPACAVCTRATHRRGCPARPQQACRAEQRHRCAVARGCQPGQPRDQGARVTALSAGGVGRARVVPPSAWRGGRGAAIRREHQRVRGQFCAGGGTAGVQADGAGRQGREHARAEHAARRVLHRRLRGRRTRGAVPCATHCTSSRRRVTTLLASTSFARNARTTKWTCFVGAIAKAIIGDIAQCRSSR